MWSRTSTSQDNAPVAEVVSAEGRTKMSGQNQKSQPTFRAHPAHQKPRAMSQFVASSCYSACNCAIILAGGFDDSLDCSASSGNPVNGLQSAL